ncbi:hypothetical protein BGX27_004430, partial [Mortierella sp. AM989]
LPEQEVADHVKKTFSELETDGVPGKQAICRSRSKIRSEQYPLGITLPPKEFPLLKAVQGKPDVERFIRGLKKNRLENQDKDTYISPRATAGMDSPAEFDLMTKAKEYLDSKKTVFLLRGGSGSGKSVFNRALELELWDKYEPNKPIPLFIELPAISEPQHDLIEKRLRKANFTEKVIKELKSRKFVLICDGYDECRLEVNLYEANQLNQSGGWKAQMVISCRTEYRPTSYKKLFQPMDRNNLGDSKLFQEAVVAPFSLDQIQEFVDKFAPSESNESSWKSENFMDAQKKIPGMQDLVKNPFVLKLSLEVLPRIVDPNKNLSANRVTRVELYDDFLSKWLERSLNRLARTSLPDGMTKLQCIDFMKKLSVDILLENGFNPVVTYYGIEEDKDSWKARYFNNKDGKNLKRESIPLTCSSGQYQFIHLSYLEYGLSLAVFDPSVPNHHKGTAFNGSNGSRSATKGPASGTEQSLLDSPLGKVIMAKNPITANCLEFLVERAQKHEPFRDQLDAVIERSKSDNDEKTRTAAANAITILVKAGIQFNGKDLRNIQIPDADLSYGVFDSALLDGADLRNVNLRNIWLQGSSLKDAKMEGAQFGEFPYIQEHNLDEVRSCVYSPDGNKFVVVLTSN